MNNQKRIKVSVYSYNPDDLIGSGYKSQVYKGQNDMNGEIVAIKVCEHSKMQHEIERQLLQQEITALQVLDSINIVKMLCYCQNTNFTYIITEYCNQGDLADLIIKRGHIPENEAVLIFYQILTGFKEQISKGVIHRDLKPSNILIKERIYKIADYGFSKMINSPKEKVYYNVGTTLYMPPQALTENKYSEKSDIWSLGVMFYQILNGKVPWQAGTEQEFVKVITTTPIQFSRNIQISSVAKDLIIKCLQLEENKRYNCNQLLEHDLFRYFQVRPSRKSVQFSFNNSQLANPENRAKTSYSQQRPNPSVQRIQSNKNLLETRQELVNYGDAVNNILNLLKLILRIAKIVDHFDFFLEGGLKEKVLYITIKHAIFKSKQLIFILNKNHSTIDQTKKSEFIVQSNLMNETFRTSFNKLWDSIHRDEILLNEILKDKKFAAAFDQSELEVESYYILMLPLIRNSIILLQNQLNFKLINVKDYDQLGGVEEGGILLLTYLVVYLEICKHVAKNFDTSIFQLNQFKLKLVVEEKPTNLTKKQFLQICQKINSLQLDYLH
ncbi:unnamed protein product (macronuclear) [Paramecium tetraurelia]|uniref:Protein kinase domain-containing protein n=1 Tax=Paramecium tetraurelia TaxID=5888 RepID=A0BM48_PARTE|nr:uncharacterized protein GSPATT00030249001 [Paramecium tetraurelia]CAK59615.1 unnamed protein product [Paramecium tetraurelia]|eukprot:XP_001427013.1 hypothetical protein (macronuclear) [Paramecium tetraurelia strain d4-2]